MNGKRVSVKELWAREVQVRRRSREIQKNPQKSIKINGFSRFVGVPGGSRGPPGGSWGPLGASGAVLVASWGVWGRLGGVLGASWGRLGPSWGHLGGVLGRLGGVLGASWGLPGASWGLLEASRERLGASWGRPGRHFLVSLSELVLGAVSEAIFEQCLTILGAKLGAKPVLACEREAR